jgi:hypothetical protein
LIIEVANLTICTLLSHESGAARRTSADDLRASVDIAIAAFIVHLLHSSNSLVSAMNKILSYQELI